MYDSIMFYVGKKTIVLNEHTYTLGELTADILNISPEDYRGMKEILLRAEEKMEQYRSTKALEHWEAANDEMLVLDGMLCAYPLFRCVKQKPCLLKEASTMLYEEEQNIKSRFIIWNTSWILQAVHICELEK